MLLNLYLKISLKKKKLSLSKKFFYVNYFRFIIYPKSKLTKQLNKNSISRDSSVGNLKSLIFCANLNKSNQLDMSTLWFLLYQQSYLSQLIKLPLVFKTFNSRNIIPYSLLRYIVHGVKLVKWKRYYITHSNEIIETLFLCLWIKNIKLFMEWMRGYFEKTNLKKHKKLFLLLNLLLGKLVWNYNFFLQLQGLRVSLRGKFGKAGSVRKTRRYIRRGRCSYTTKSISVVSQTNVIKTLTGVFSIKFEVFF